jgi:hypothetical protein
MRHLSFSSWDLLIVLLVEQIERGAELGRGHARSRRWHGRQAWKIWNAVSVVKLSVSLVKPIGVCSETDVAEMTLDGICDETVSAVF